MRMSRLLLPLGVKAHSFQGVVSSKAYLRVHLCKLSVRQHKGQSLHMKILIGFHSINSHGISCLSFINHSFLGSKQVKNLKKR